MVWKKVVAIDVVCKLYRKCHVDIYNFVVSCFIFILFIKLLLLKPRCHSISINIKKILIQSVWCLCFVFCVLCHLIKPFKTILILMKVHNGWNLNFLFYAMSLLMRFFLHIFWISSTKDESIDKDEKSVITKFIFISSFSVQGFTLNST